MAAADDKHRDTMMGEIVSGAGHAADDADATSAKVVLVRGCDPIMAERAGKILPPLIGHATVVSVTDDVTFLALLESRTFDVILFAPGACRHDAAKRKIPGGHAATYGWTLDDYRAKVRATQVGVPIVETTEEHQVVPLLRAALKLGR